MLLMMFFIFIGLFGIAGVGFTVVLPVNTWLNTNNVFFTLLAALPFGFIVFVALMIYMIFG